MSSWLSDCEKIKAATDALRVPPQRRERISDALHAAAVAPVALDATGPHSVPLAAKLAALGVAAAVAITLATHLVREGGRDENMDPVPPSADSGGNLEPGAVAPSAP